MKLVQITMGYFKSFKAEDSTFRFGSKGEFNFLTGRNEAEPDLGANGAGKSAVWDALTWVLYGKTARGLKAGSVATWDSTVPCEVSLVFERPGSSRETLFRSWHPNELSLWGDDTADEGRTIDQDYINNLVGLTFHEFLLSVLMSQFGSMFLDMTPSEKATVFDNVLDLDCWLQWSKEAGTDALEAEHKIVDTEACLELSRETRASLRERRTDAMRIVLEEDGAHAHEQETLEADLKHAKNELKNAVRLERTKKEDAKVCGDEAAKMGPEILELEADLKQFDAEYRSAEDKVTALKLSTKELKFDADRLEGLGSECPECQQEVPDEHKAKLLKGLWKRLDDLRTASQDAEEDASELKGGCWTQSQLIRQEHDKQVLLWEKQTELLKQAAPFTRQAGQWGEAVDRLEDEKNRSVEWVNPWAKELRTITANIKVELKRKKALAAILLAHQRDLGALEFWKKGFKEIRLYIIDEALTQLEIEINSALVELGLHGWAIGLDTERVTQSGSVSKGFTVLIQSPHNTDPVPWEAWSGGESQRLRIAGAIGLANMISNRKGVDLGLEIWDEPSQHLSTSGIDDLLEVLRARAELTDKSIWLVDHRSLSSGLFDSVVEVVKDSDGSKIVEL